MSRTVISHTTVEPESNQSIRAAGSDRLSLGDAGGGGGIQKVVQPPPEDIEQMGEIRSMIVLRRNIDSDHTGMKGPQEPVEKENDVDGGHSCGTSTHQQPSSFPLRSCCCLAFKRNLFFSPWMNKELIFFFFFWKIPLQRLLSDKKQLSSALRITSFSWMKVPLFLWRLLSRRKQVRFHKFIWRGACCVCVCVRVWDVWDGSTCSKQREG